MKKYDVAVIGGGPGGYVAAIKAAHAGMKCALVEKENLGGVCLNWGCIPTKSLLRNAEILKNVKGSEAFGITVKGEVSARYQDAQKRSRAVSAKLVNGVQYLMKKNGIDVYRDEAVFEDKKTLLLKQSGDKLSCENVIIAAGARSLQIPIANMDNDHILDYRRALMLDKTPKSVVIIGAGAIGMEFATVWNTYGADVTVVEMQANVLTNEDADISSEVKKAYEKRGITIHTNAKVANVEETAGCLRATVTKDNNEMALDTEYVLVSVGITPNSDRLNIDAIGCLLDDRGYIKTDVNMKTNIDGIYAIGDITGKLALAHVASQQGVVAVNHLAGKAVQEIPYENIPKCTYGFPETASAGLTEQQAKDRGYEVKSGVFPFSANGKAIAYGQDEGFIKVVADAQYHQVLGVHMIGCHVAELICNAAAYLDLELTLDEFEDMVFPHPTLSEAIMEAAHCAEGNPIHI